MMKISIFFFLRIRLSNNPRNSVLKTTLNIKLKDTVVHRTINSINTRLFAETNTVPLIKAMKLAK